MKSTCGNKARFEIELPLLHTKDEGDVCSPIFCLYPYISPWQGLLFLTVAVITIAAGCIFIYENRTHFSWADAVMVLVYCGLAVFLGVCGIRALGLI